MGASLLKYILTSWQTVKKGTKPSKRRPSAYMKYGRVAFAQEGKSFAEQKILGLGDAVHSFPVPSLGEEALTVFFRFCRFGTLLIV